MTRYIVLVVGLLVANLAWGQVEPCDELEFEGGVSTMNCDSAHGTAFWGYYNEVPYCISKRQMNYWSAEIWCQSIGGKLVQKDLDCADCSDTTYFSCGNFFFSAYNQYSFWFSNVAESGFKNYLITMNCESWSPTYRDERYYAVCRSQ